MHNKILNKNLKNIFTLLNPIQVQLYKVLQTNNTYTITRKVVIGHWTFMVTSTTS